ncbi:phosphonatase-like hydrolase [Streptomyces paromomycinus]|uniref:Putative haloacid dehalogenase-like hydrolase n=1 Tax=Streptomyces paromomycinus TaxID=92743 RepID=A0A401W8A4_STREY|nr:phosphonatase-like hydrolase [Streptomyces paromomycinus]GCD45568.1 putative haloacid dehalogenase-like hydrolase [Streptomyces paromomycinus]
MTVDDTERARISLVVLDMAGTTVADGGLVEQAFSVAAGRLGVVPGSAEHEKHLAYVRATMGESKISVFRHLFGDEERARRANSAFEEAYGELVDGGRIAPLPGAREAVEALQDAGRTVVLSTGFARVTQDAILDALGWRDLVTLTLCPADAGGRGRPYPDMVLAALLRTGAADSVQQIAVAGDTSYDMRSGRRAGASVVAGVLTGAHDEAALRGAGATHVLGSVAGLPALLDGGEEPQSGGRERQSGGRWPERPV